MSVGVAELLGDWGTNVRRTLRSRQGRQTMFRLAVVVAAGAAAWASSAAPTHYETLDKFYVGALAGVTAYFGGTARRWTWFLPAGVGAALAGDNVAIGIACAALLLGFWSVLSDSRTPARAALVTGLGTAAAMRTGPLGFHGSTAIIVGIAVLPVIVSGYRNASRRVRRRARQVGLIVGAVAGLMLLGVALGFLLVGNDLVKGMEMADDGLVAARDSQDELASQRLTDASRLLDSTSSTLESWFVTPARGLPVVGPNLRAVERLTNEVGDLSHVTAAAAAAADVDQLRVDKGRLDPEAVKNVEDTLADVAGSGRHARSTVDDVASPWLVAPVADRIGELSDQLDSNLPSVSSARDAVKVAHGLLAPGDARRYLVLFTSPVEARGRTGFPGNYAELLVQDGEITMPRFGRISELEEYGSPDTRKIDMLGTEDYMRRYGPFHPAHIWRNVTMSPDLQTIALVVQQLYPESGGAKIDGLLTVDPTGLAALMHFTPGVSVPEVPFPLTAENTEDFLHLQQYTAFPDAAQRVDVLGTIAEQTFKQLLAADLPTPRELVDTLAPAVEGGHIQFTTYDPEEQEYFNEIGISGGFKGLADQVLSVVANNAGGNKLDLFMQRSLRYEAQWDPATSQVVGKITVQLRNNADGSAALPDDVLGNLVDLPRGTNRTYLSIYTSHLLDGARINGQPAKLAAQAELATNVYSTFVDVPPKGVVTVELDVHGVEPIPGFYSLQMLQQPMVEAEQIDYSITVAGNAPLALDRKGAKFTVDGRTVHFNGPLDRPMSIGIDTTGNLAKTREKFGR